MLGQARCDIILKADRDPAMVECCVRSLLDNGGTMLRRVMVIDDTPDHSALAGVLDHLVIGDRRIHILRSSAFQGTVDSFNRGIGERDGDVVLISSDCVVSANWLSELAAVAHSDERTACASPLLHDEGTCFVPLFDGEATETIEALIRESCTDLPRWTTAPCLAGACIYLRDDIIDAVGFLNIKCGSIGAAIDDWIMRASTLGFTSKRANHVYVHRSRSQKEPTDDHAPQPGGEFRTALHNSTLAHHLQRFNRSLDGRLAAHAVSVTQTGKLRVALDIRHVPPEEVGTRTYTVNLARALGEQAGIELTLLVSDHAQARGMKGRVVTEEHWADDVAVIHKPSQVIDPRELSLLFGSSAHVVISYLDLIGYRIPASFPTTAGYDLYRATSNLTLQATQRIVAISESAAGEIAAEFGIPREEIAAVHLGVDTALFSHRAHDDADVWRQLGLLAPYFFSIATDFPHKNLSNLLDAYARLHGRWPTANLQALFSPVTHRVHELSSIPGWNRRRSQMA